MKSRTFILILVVTLLAGCAGVRKAATPHPLVGNWTYEVVTPMGNEPGNLSILEGEEGISGYVVHMGGQRIDLESLEFNDGKMVFSLRTPNLITVQATIDGDAFEGIVSNPSEGVTGIPITGSRSKE